MRTESSQANSIKSQFTWLAFRNAVVQFLKTNYLMVLYVFCAVLIELTGVCVTSSKFYISSPWTYISIVMMFAFISFFLPGNKSRFIYFISVLSVMFLLDLTFIIIYESNGTIFDFAMLQLRNDAMMIVESLPIDFTYVTVSAALIALYGVFGWLLRKRMPQPVRSNRTRNTITSLLLVGMIGMQVGATYAVNSKSVSADLSYKLFAADTSDYAHSGVMGNFINQMYKGAFFPTITDMSTEDIDDFIYSETTDETPLTGIAKDYNVVTILGESFEWFTFLADAAKYPNGIDSTAVTTAQLRAAFPNLYRMYENKSTVVLDNAHSREKTDISENKALIGNYPLYKYINYDYAENALPYSLPNIYKLFNEGAQTAYFHDGTATFYNRNKHMPNMGFDSFTTSEAMSGMDLDETGLGERNLDSQMIESCKEKMFPTDTKFFTQITTITQHGQYAYRENLKQHGYYDTLDRYGIAPEVKGTSQAAEDANALRYYLAAGLDLDKALGIMFDYLESHGLADKTMVVIYGDHNVYYQGLSNYVKNIYNTTAENYIDLYRTPVMIKIGELDVSSYLSELDFASGRHINKFTCVADIYSTVLDLMGVKTFKNLSYGTSAFAPESSLLYSRAYDIFLDDQIYFNSLANIRFKTDKVDDAYIESVTVKAQKLLEKVSYTNRIFATDYFATEQENPFSERLKTLNGIA